MGMTKSDDPNRYLLKRNGWYHYQRSVPVRLRAFYDGPLIRITLDTGSLDEARERRDALARADNEYWHSLKQKLRLEAAGQVMDVAPASKRYEVAKARALAAGFRYRPLHELADPNMIDELVRRALAVGDRATADGRTVPAIADAILGGVEAPKVLVSEAMELYQTKIALPNLVKKSPHQKQRWKATKDLSLRYFVEVIGDLAMTDITREHALSFYEYWNLAVSPEDPEAGAKQPKTADRHFGDIRRLYSDYFKYIGEEERPNPFRNLTFKERRNRGTRKYPPIPDKWVCEKILVPGWYGNLSEEIFLAPLMLIETGCRPGEIINLRPEDIRLDDPIPHLVIADREDREVKTQTSVRCIPLVGISLEAARRAPKGFPKYHDKTNSFSAAVNARYRRKGLFPTDKHVVYSFRHAFEDRMKEGHIDYELRMLLMGHKNERPEYGTGGSLEYQRDELLKIAHAVPKEFFSAFDAARTGK